MGCLKLCEPEDNSAGKSENKIKRHGIRASAFNIRDEIEIKKYPKSK